MSRQTRTPGLSAFSLSPFPTPTNPSSNPTDPTTTTAPPTRQTLYTSYGTASRASQLSALQTQLSCFRALLHNFALLHSAQIKQDASFREEFVSMCRKVGVDPAAGLSEVVSSDAGGGGGGWLGKGLLMKGGRAAAGERGRERAIEVANRVVEICRGRRGVDGGFTPLETVRVGVERGDGRGYSVGGEIGGVGAEEVVAAIEGLGVLGGGFRVVGGMVRSVPRELSEDQGRVLEALLVLGWVSIGVLVDNFGWAGERAEGVCADLVGEGVVWVDEQGEGGEREFWGTGGVGGWED